MRLISYQNGRVPGLPMLNTQQDSVLMCWSFRKPQATLGSQYDSTSFHEDFCKALNTGSFVKVSRTEFTAFTFPTWVVYHENNLCVIPLILSVMHKLSGKCALQDIPVIAMSYLSYLRKVKTENHCQFS